LKTPFKQEYEDLKEENEKLTKQLTGYAEKIEKLSMY